MNQRRYVLGFTLALLGCFTGSRASAQPASSNANPVHTVPMKVVPPPPPQPQPAAVPNQPGIDTLLKWDAETKEATVTNGTAQANFVFNLTNVSSSEVTILSAHASCGCTVAKLPQQPWILPAGTNTELQVTMNLAGKSGSVTKTVTVNTDKGAKIVYVRSNILPAPAPAMGEREANQKLALVDRQAVFKGDCAKCHTEPAKGQAGPALYASACGICHEAEHRATMVPNLHAITQETNAEFWRNWITQGKAGTLMPAFSEKQGGILTDAQIESLVGYLVSTIPSKPQANAEKPASKAL